MLITGDESPALEYVDPSMSAKAPASHPRASEESVDWRGAGVRHCVEGR